MSRNDQMFMKKIEKAMHTVELCPYVDRITANLERNEACSKIVINSICHQFHHPGLRASREIAAFANSIGHEREWVTVWPVEGQRAREIDACDDCGWQPAREEGHGSMIASSFGTNCVLIMAVPLTRTNKAKTQSRFKPSRCYFLRMEFTFDRNGHKFVTDLRERVTRSYSAMPLAMNPQMWDGLSSNKQTEDRHSNGML
uniref:DUF4218 domain-containing protein n=1 Tax=Panagrellus redivivus TaxID=6233 RepID=A0A7E4USB9_PANRE